MLFYFGGLIMSKEVTHEMHETFSLVAKELKRQAIIMDVGVQEPSTDAKASWIGKVLCAKEGETWPEWEGKPMLPLAQINLTELPFKPKGLEDYAWISLFVDEEETPFDEAQGNGWVMRAYKSLDELVPLKQVEANFCKLGGWAYLIQGALGWMHPHIEDEDIEFLFQIDTDEKSRWM